MIARKISGSFEFVLATPEDAPAISSLRNDVALRLTLDFGKGHWGAMSTERGVLADMRNARLYVMRMDGDIVASLRLATKKPWAIDRTYFTECDKPLYLTSMAVDPEFQRQGIGRRCLKEVEQEVFKWPADAVRLDAYDADAGAGGFYQSCGYREVGRATYRGTPLVYFEWLASGKAADL